MKKYNAQGHQRIRTFFVKNITLLEEVSQVLEYPFYLATDLGGKLRAVEMHDYLLDREEDNGDRFYKLKPEYWGEACVRI